MKTCLVHLKKVPPVVVPYQTTILKVSTPSLQLAPIQMKLQNGSSTAAIHGSKNNHQIKKLIKASCKYINRAFSQTKQSISVRNGPINSTKLQKLVKALARTMIMQLQAVKVMTRQMINQQNQIVTVQIKVIRLMNLSKQRTLKIALTVKIN